MTLFGVSDAVKYVTNVESYDRRIQSAINIQGKKMQRRAEFLLTRPSPTSGLEVTGPQIAK